MVVCKARLPFYNAPLRFNYLVPAVLGWLILSMKYRGWVVLEGANILGTIVCIQVLDSTLAFFYPDILRSLRKPSIGEMHLFMTPAGRAQFASC